MSDQAHIRRAAPDDVEELARLRWQLYAEEGPSPDESFDIYRARFLAFARPALTGDRWAAWVAEADDRFVGALWRHRTPRIPQPGRGDPADLAYITSVYVEPAFRSTGLGSRLLRLVLDDSRTEGFSLAMVWPSDRSIPFYERAGFTRPTDPLILDLGGAWHHDGPSRASGDELA